MSKPSPSAYSEQNVSDQTTDLAKIINPPSETNLQLLFHGYHQVDFQRIQFCSSVYSFFLPYKIEKWPKARQN